MYKYHVWRSSQNSQYYWNLKAANNEKIAWSGELYVTKQSCLNGLNLFHDNAASAPVNDLTAYAASPRVGRHEFEVYKDGKGEYRWRFQAANNKIVAVSGEGYVSKQGCLNGIQLVKTNSRATVVDHTKKAVGV